MSFTVNSLQMLNVLEILGGGKILFMMDSVGLKFYKEVDFKELVVHRLDRQKLFDYEVGGGNLFSIGDSELLRDLVQNEKIRIIKFNETQRVFICGNLRYRVNIEEQVYPLFPPGDEIMEIPLDCKLLQQIVRYSNSNELTMTLKSTELFLETNNINCTIPLGFEELEECSIVVSITDLFRKIINKFNGIVKVKINPQVTFTLGFNNSTNYYCVH